jgi:hypothetical protein
MDDSSHQHNVEPMEFVPEFGSDIGSDFARPAKPARQSPRQIVPKSIVQKMVDRPVTTAAIFVLLGAFAAEGLALLFARAQARNALESSALRNLRLAQRLDPHRDPLV